MAKLQELQGWRRASGEELNYIRGALGTRIKRDRSAGRLAAGAITLLGLGLTGAIWPMAVSMARQISGDWDGETVITALMVLGLLAVGLLVFGVGIRMIWDGLYHKAETRRYNALREGRFWVLDIEVTDIVSHFGESGIAGKFKDSQGTLCDDVIWMHCCYKYPDSNLLKQWQQEGTAKAILVVLDEADPMSRTETTPFYFKGILPMYHAQGEWFQECVRKGIQKRIEVVAAIILDKEKVFATQRGYGEFKDGWEFPGGKIEQGETPGQALKREIKEELDIEIEVGELLETVEYDYPNFHLTMHCFLCSIKSGEFVLKEHEAAKWLTGESLDSVDWLPADKGLIQQIKNLLVLK